MSPSFVELIQRTDEDRRGFETNPTVLDFVANGLLIGRYRNLLTELYHVVWHFNPICAAAASRLGDDFREVRYFLYEHMKEEAGHEEWVINDLVATGAERHATINSKPSVHCLTLLGFNYYAADRLHPCSVLGMLYALEVIASVYGGPMTTAIKESLLLQDDRGVSFINSHASMDAEHMIDLRKVINTITSSIAVDSIVESTRINFRQFAYILEAI